MASRRDYLVSARKPSPRHLLSPLIPAIMIRPTALILLLPPLRLHRRRLTRRTRNIATASPTSPSSSPAAPSTPEPTSTHAIGGRIRILGLNPASRLPVRCLGELVLSAIEATNLGFEFLQSPRIALQHDGPALDRFVRHACLGLESCPRLPSSHIECAAE